MDICILSMQDINNFGSLLQAYSLKKIIKSFGHEVNFIKIEPMPQDDLLMERHALNKFHEGEGGGIFAKIKKLDRYFFNRIHIRKMQDIQDKYFEDFRGQLLYSVNEKSNYDLCVIGSDEVFNCLNSSASWGFTSQLFGNVKQANKVITYAASCGSTSYEDVPVKVRNKIEQSFKNITAFSVRDENTYKFVSKFTDKDIEFNLDPVVVGDFSEEIASVGDVSNKLPKHYCIIYSYYNRICEREEIDSIQKFCAAHGLTPISIGAGQKWIKNHIPLTPFEMLAAFKSADFVITDTFHGAIFSTKYANRFAVMTRQSNYNKLSDLVKRLGIDRHLIKSFNDLKYINNKQIKKFAMINAILMIILFVYNLTLRNEAGCLLYTVLALPYIYRNEEGHDLIRH